MSLSGPGEPCLRVANGPLITTRDGWERRTASLTAVTFTSPSGKPTLRRPHNSRLTTINPEYPEYMSRRQRGNPFRDSEERGRMNSSQLPRIDSPLAKILLSEYISRLFQETIRFRALPYKKLAQQVSIPSPALKVAMEGQLGLTRGQWNMLGQLVGVTTTFQVRLSERHGQPCWEAYFPPVSSQVEGSTKESHEGGT